VRGNRTGEGYFVKGRSGNPVGRPKNPFSSAGIRPGSVALFFAASITRSTFGRGEVLGASAARRSSAGVLGFRWPV
jgi:hypothetical protein